VAGGNDKVTCASNFVSKLGNSSFFGHSFLANFSASICDELRHATNDFSVNFLSKKWPDNRASDWLVCGLRAAAPREAVLEGQCEEEGHPPWPQS
jgi:hypothetical protein